MARIGTTAPAGGNVEAKAQALPDATVSAASGESSAQALSARSALISRIKNHCDTIWTRAKQERASREAKWRENLLVADGQVYSAGDARKAATPGAWRGGDEPNQTERLRVARQKCVAAKVAIGDTLYKNERVPFLLSWTASMGAGDPTALEKIRQRVDEICFVSGMPQRLRIEIEDAASYGEGWIHGTVMMDSTGRPVAGVEAVSPWEMFFDEAGGEDLAEAEYVVRERRVSAFEVSRIVKGAETIYDVEAVLTALEQVRSGGESTGDPKKTATRTRTETIVWREMWLHVPASLVTDPTAVLPQRGNRSETATMDWVGILVVLAGDEIVGVKVDPGPVPFFRAVWDYERTRALPQGIYDVMGPTQEVITGVVRAWLANVRVASRLLLAGKREKLKQDPERIAEGITFLDLDSDCPDVRQALQQFAVSSNAGELTQAIEMLLQFSDLESNIPRIQQGQQVSADNTAFELRARLSASGKYLNEIVRRQDGCIRWSIGWALYVMALAGEIPHEGLLQISPRGFAQFADLVSRLDGLLQLLGLGGQNQRIDALLNHEEIVRQVVAADDLDVGKVLLSPEQRAQQAMQEQQAQQQSQENQLALANAQADLAVKQAKAARDNAAASEAASRGQLGRAKFIHDVEKTGAAGGGGDVSRRGAEAQSGTGGGVAGAAEGAAP